jgi:hypothetical protein
VCVHIEVAACCGPYGTKGAAYCLLRYFRDVFKKLLTNIALETVEGRAFLTASGNLLSLPEIATELKSPLTVFNAGLMKGEQLEDVKAALAEVRDPKNKWYTCCLAGEWHPGAAVPSRERVPTCFVGTRSLLGTAAPGCHPPARQHSNILQV